MAVACPSIVTGDQFLTRIITNIDCQAQLVGSLGWQALGQPGSLAAGMLLFEPTRGLFSGWLRGLVLALIGLVGTTLVLAVELGVLLPWLTDALRVRALGYAIPAAPTELFAMTLGFTIVQLAMIWLLAKVAFTRGWLSLPVIGGRSEMAQAAIVPTAATSSTRVFAETRAQRIADAMELQLRREEGRGSGRTQIRALTGPDAGRGAAGEAQGTIVPAQERLGSSWRRTSQRSSVASRRRDGNR